MRSVAAARRVTQARTAAIDPKFRAGPNELEQEHKLQVLQPRDAVQHEQMARMVEKLRNSYVHDPAMQNALALWQGQLMTGQLEDEQKFQFVRRFYWWLLGRGTDKDHGKTSWGRANAAVINREVSLYIEQFAQRRLDFALQLSLLAQRVPTSLLGYWLYFKYIVDGNLKRREVGGIAFWDLSDDNYLQDFDLFYQYFTKESGGYQDLILGNQRSDGKPPFDGTHPFPYTADDMQKFSIDDNWKKSTMVDRIERADAVPPSMHVKVPPKDKGEEEDTLDASEEYGAVTGGVQDVSTEEVVTPARLPMTEREAINLLNQAGEHEQSSDPRLVALRREAELIAESSSNKLLQELLALPDAPVQSEEEKLRKASLDDAELLKAAAKSKTGQMMYRMLSKLDQFAKQRWETLRSEMKAQSENIDARIGGVEQTVSRLREEINKGARIDAETQAQLNGLESKLRESGLPQGQRNAAMHEVVLTKEAIGAVSLSVEEAVNRAMNGRLATTVSVDPKLQRDYDALLARQQAMEGELGAAKAAIDRLTVEHAAALQREGALNTENAALNSLIQAMQRNEKQYIAELAATRDRLRTIEREHARVVGDLAYLQRAQENALKQHQSTAVSAATQAQTQQFAEQAVARGNYDEWEAANRAELQEAKEKGAITELPRQARLDADYWRRLLIHQRGELEEYRRKPKREREPPNPLLAHDPEYNVEDPRAHK